MKASGFTEKVNWNLFDDDVCPGVSIFKGVTYDLSDDTNDKVITFSK